MTVGLYFPFASLTTPVPRGTGEVWWEIYRGKGGQTVSFWQISWKYMIQQHTARDPMAAKNLTV